MVGIEDLRRAIRVMPPQDAAYVAGLEAAAVALVERETGHSYAEGGTVSRVGQGGPVLLLDDEAETITAVTEYAYPGAQGTTIDSYDFELQEGRKLWRAGRGAVWLDGYRYEIDFERAAEAPADIKQAVTQIVALWYEKRLPVADAPYSEIPFGAREIIANAKRMVI